MAIAADHVGRTRSPVSIFIETPRDLHPLHGLAARVAGRRGEGDELRSIHAGCPGIVRRSANEVVRKKTLAWRDRTCPPTIRESLAEVNLFSPLAGPHPVRRHGTSRRDAIAQITESAGRPPDCMSFHFVEGALYAVFDLPEQREPRRPLPSRERLRHHRGRAGSPNQVRGAGCRLGRAARVGQGLGGQLETGVPRIISAARGKSGFTWRAQGKRLAANVIESFPTARPGPVGLLRAQRASGGLDLPRFRVVRLMLSSVSVHNRRLCTDFSRALAPGGSPARPPRRPAVPTGAAGLPTPTARLGRGVAAVRLRVGGAAGPLLRRRAAGAIGQSGGAVPLRRSGPGSRAARRPPGRSGPRRRSAVDLREDRVDDHRHRRLGVLAPRWTQTRQAIWSPQPSVHASEPHELSRSSSAMSSPSTRIVGELTKRSARACSADSTSTLLTSTSARRLQDVAHDLERRLEAAVGAQTAGAGRKVEKQKVDRQPTPGLRGHPHGRSARWPSHTSFHSARVCHPRRRRKAETDAPRAQPVRATSFRDPSGRAVSTGRSCVRVR